MQQTQHHRSTDEQIALPVYIRYGRRPFLNATARELSVDGMLLSVQALTLPSGTPVELELRCLGVRWLLQASVSQGGSGGIRVLFDEPQPELLAAALQQQAIASPHQAPSPAAAHLQAALPR